MDGRYIIPVPAANDDGPVVVIEVKQTGSDPLDVRLVGCEGEFPYVTTIKQRNIGKLKTKGSDEEWETILSHFLLQTQPTTEKARILDDVRMEYTLKGKHLQVAIRRHVQGIKMTLGQIELEKEPEEEIDPIDWAYTSAQAHNAALQEIAQLKAKLDGEEGTLDKLNAQFEEFIKAKEETETIMLQQFMVLLNEKKRKIRDQSRLLAGAKVDVSTASAIQSARKGTKPRKAGPSRTSKRKAPETAPEVKDESDDVGMDVDPNPAEEPGDESEAEAETPDRNTDVDTEDEEGIAATAPLTKDHPDGKGKANTAGDASGFGAPTGMAPDEYDYYQRQLMLLDQQNKKRLLLAIQERDRMAAESTSPPIPSTSLNNQPSPPVVDDDDDETDDEEL